MFGKESEYPIYAILEPYFHDNVCSMITKSRKTDIGNKCINKFAKDRFESNMDELITYTCSHPKKWGSFRGHLHNSSIEIYRSIFFF